MIILAIDTCEQRGSVAVLGSGVALATSVHADGTDYSEWLIPAVEGALARAGMGMKSVDLFAVATGPGSFTGVRVGLTTLKGWCEVYGKPVVGVSRLEALARCSKLDRGLVAAYYDAQRGQIFAGLYSCADEKAGRIADEMVITPGEFLELVEKQVHREAVRWVTLDARLVRSLEGWKGMVVKGDRMEEVSPELAAAIGELAAQRALAGEFTDPLALDANYVRRSDAEIFWRGPAAQGRGRV